MMLIPIVLLIVASSFDTIHGASSCFTCNPCGTTWNQAVTTVIQTSTLNDYCRKTVTGNLVVKDSASTCNPVNILNNAVYCCQTDLCNSATRHSLKMIYLGFLLIWQIYY